MEPIQIPREWDGRGLIPFEKFCTLIRTPSPSSVTGVDVSDHAGHGSTAAPPLHHHRRGPPLR